MTVRDAKFEDMALAAGIMVTSFRTAFADFVSPETMDASVSSERNGSQGLIRNRGVPV